MSERVDLLITPLATNHHRAGFQCGVDALDDYLHKQAGHDVKRRVSRVSLATTLDHPDVITGYYTLSSLSIEFDQLSEQLARRLPRHPLPAALLGRLAISQDAQGRGIDGLLLADAIKSTLAVSNQIAIYALVVDVIDVIDVIDDQVRGFYEQYGFLPLGSDSRRLFLPLQSFLITRQTDHPAASAHTKPSTDASSRGVTSAKNTGGAKSGAKIGSPQKPADIKNPVTAK